MQIRTIRTPGLGDATHLIAHDGLAVVVDPQRDVERFIDAARADDAAIGYVLETHVHNDYVSGARALADLVDAQLVLPAGAGAAFQYRPAFHLEDVPIRGGLVIRPLHTPGHTPEHVSYLVVLEGRAMAVFSGGSLLVGAAGRTDLLGQARARQLARLQYGSVNRLASLPVEVGLFPTHGEGSFCTSSGAGRATSTVGDEKRSNPVLAYPDPDAFADRQLDGLQPYPRYYAHMAALNLEGRPRLEPRVPPVLSEEDVASLEPSVWIVDARPRRRFAAGHLPGAIGIELADDFATWVGWLLPFDAPMVVVLDDDQDVSAALTALGRVGFEHVRGLLRGGPASGTSYRTVNVDEFVEAVKSGAARQVLDVRSPAEVEAGSVPGAAHHYLPDLRDGPPRELRTHEPVWVACASGYRASIAAGLLEHGGYRPVVLAQGGIIDVIDRFGQG